MSSAMRFLSHPSAPPWKAPCVLVADSELLVRQSCKQIAEKLGCRVFLAEDAASALRRLTTNSVHLVLLDSLLVGRNGNADLLSTIKAQQPEAQVVILGRRPRHDSEAAALKDGACDYLSKPLQVPELKKLFRGVARQSSDSLEPYNTLERPARGSDFRRIVGESPEMKKLERMIPNIAFSKHPVLVTGESGTGKERLARAIHEAGPLRDHSFVVVHCSSSPASLEAELFGEGMTARGSKTRGPRLASRCTVFLHDIAQMPLTTQGKLLRALQEKQLRVAGSFKPAVVEAQIVAATQQDLDAAVRQGMFRRDLFLYVNIVSLRLPALRDRKEDIGLLAEYFLGVISEERRLHLSMSPEFLIAIHDYDWPGNLRELENCLRRAAVIAEGPVLKLEHLSAHVLRTNIGPEPGDPLGLLKIVPLAEMERQTILRALEQLKGDKQKAAQLLGIGKTTLYRKLKEYGIGERSTRIQAAGK